MAKYIVNHFFSILDTVLLVVIVIRGNEQLEALRKLIDHKDSVIAAKSTAIAKVALGLKESE